MTIRTKLAVSMNALLILTMGLLGYGILKVEQTYKRRELIRAGEVIENSVRRVAFDTLLQKDDLQLVSYVNFLKGQYPALTYAKLHWQQPDGRTRDVQLGDFSHTQGINERLLEISEPTDARHKVDIRLGIDESLIEQEVRLAQKQLERLMLVVWLCSALAGLLLSLVLAQTLTEPLTRLGTVAENIGRGSLGLKLAWQSEDEIGKLVTAFNHMSERLAELDETKKNFVSTVSHELRSPLGAISSFLSLIEAQVQSSRDAQAPKTLEYLGRVRANVSRLDGFISSLLDAAKIEKGKLECVLKPMKLGPVAQDVCQFFAPKAAEQGVELVNALDGNVPPVNGDGERLRQVLVNLVANALKFTPKGGRVELSAEQFREGEARWVEVSVADTGRGMTAEDARKLFKLFSQGSNAAAAQGARGTGLGLFIVKSIVEQHGGRVAVEAAPGQGTQIKFTLQAASA